MLYLLLEGDLKRGRTTRKILMTYGAVKKVLKVIDLFRIASC